MPGQRAQLIALAFACTIWGSAQGDDLDDIDEDDGLEQDALSAEQMQSIHQKMDSNGDGKASMVEVLAFSASMRRQIAVKDVKTVLDEMDLDKDGKLSVEELMKDMDMWSDDEEEDQRESAMRKEVETAKFGAADKDKDGLLDVEELPALFYPETHEGVLDLTARQTLQQKDLDGDGLLSLQEFWEGDALEGEEMAITEDEQEDFQKLDTDRSGKLDLQELKTWESGRFHTEEAMKTLFELADRDSDMHVTAEELGAAREQIAGSDAQYHLMEWAEHYEL